MPQRLHLHLLALLPRTQVLHDLLLAVGPVAGEPAFRDLHALQGLLTQIGFVHVGALPAVPEHMVDGLPHDVLSDRGVRLPVQAYGARVDRPLVLPHAAPTLAEGHARRPEVRVQRDGLQAAGGRLAELILVLEANTPQVVGAGVRRALSQSLVEMGARLRPVVVQGAVNTQCALDVRQHRALGQDAGVEGGGDLDQPPRLLQDPRYAVPFACVPEGGS
mmetsp:Transcript_1966/g.5727  ORF Transcript_1966/g.5727 Transcript_1966/m.5727 type:complete len:219 (-) Transcript_1966:1467-2123(-)